MDRLKKLWRKLNSPLEDLWLLIVAVGLCEVILFGLIYWIGPLLPR